jgi:hypothetical protein
MAELVIRKDPEGNVPGRRDRSEPVYSVIYHVGADGRSAWVEGEEGRIPIPLSTALEATDPMRVIEVPDIEPGFGGDTEAIRFGERGSVPPEERDQPATEAMRRAVLAREGHRCAACRSRHVLRAHHLKSRAKGGATEIEYLVGLCDTCHSLAHEGFLRLEVDAAGVLIMKDAEGRLIRKERLASEELGSVDAPLVLVERLESPAAAAFENGARAPLEATQVVVAPRSLPESDAQALKRAAESEPAGQAVDGVVAVTATPTGSLPGDCAPAVTPSGARAPLEATQVVVAQGSRSDLSTLESIDDLPGLLTAAGWRSLEERLEWSASRHAFILRPPWSVRGSVLPDGARGHDQVEDAPAPPAGVRPETFSDIIGQGRVVENLLLAVRTALDRGEAMGHVLLSGPPGLGKTTLGKGAGLGARRPAPLDPRCPRDGNPPAPRDPPAPPAR